jgi:hypothetical protein
MLGVIASIAIVGNLAPMLQSCFGLRSAPALLPCYLGKALMNKQTLHAYLLILNALKKMDALRARINGIKDIIPRAKTRGATSRLRMELGALENQLKDANEEYVSACYQYSRS